MLRDFCGVVADTVFFVIKYHRKYVGGVFMLESDLETFIHAADSKSFCKASEELFLSPNAVKKRINHIEEETGLKLFERSKKGLFLTKAGKAFYSDAIKILQSYKNAVAKAKRIQEADSSVIKIGLMNTFSDEFMMSGWFDVRKELFALGKTNSVLYSSTEDVFEMLSEIGQDIDIAIDVYDKDVAAKAGLLTVKTSDFGIVCGISKNHRFFGKQSLSFRDFSGETVYLLRRKRSSAWDKIRNELIEKCPECNIEDIDEFSIKNLNRCENENGIILLSSNWLGYCPFLQLIPLECEIPIEFGFYYPKKSSQKLKNFISIINNAQTHHGD